MRKETGFLQNKNNYRRYHHIKSFCKVKREGNNNPLISIVIPTYKKTEMFKIALNSVLDFNGGYDYEIVVVNDDPNDNEMEQYIRNLNVRNISYFINEKNLGLFGNWNRCIELAQGQWVAILNDDDYLYKNYLEEVVNLLTNQTKIDYLYIAHHIVKIKTPEQARQLFKIKEKQTLKSTNRRNKKDIWKKGPLFYKINLLDFFMTQSYTHPLGGLVRREKILELGGYNEDFYPSADWILNVNYMLKYNMFYYNRTLGCRSEGINLSSSQNTKKKFIEIDYLFRKEIAHHIKLPLKQWYTNCLLHDYAKGMNILNKITIEPIKNCTSYEIMIYHNIRKRYEELRNVINYFKYQQPRKKEKR